MLNINLFSHLLLHNKYMTVDNKSKYKNTADKAGEKII